MDNLSTDKHCLLRARSTWGRPKPPWNANASNIACLMKLMRWQADWYTQWIVVCIYRRNGMMTTPVLSSQNFPGSQYRSLECWWTWSCHVIPWRRQIQSVSMWWAGKSCFWASKNKSTLLQVVPAGAWTGYASFTKQYPIDFSLEVNLKFEVQSTFESRPAWIWF